jgi:hypothetical protein
VARATKVQPYTNTNNTGSFNSTNYLKSSIPTKPAGVYQSVHCVLDLTRLPDAVVTGDLRNLSGEKGFRSTVVALPVTISSARALPEAGPFRMPQQL